MEYRRLGQTDIQVSTVAMGCWAIVGDSTWGRQDERDSIAAIEAALDAGVNFFDTAELYGDGYSETLLGKTLGPRRRQAVIASKAAFFHLSKSDLQEACEGSLKRLGSDWIDLYQIHWPSRTVLLAETLEGLERLKEQGKIRAVGVSNFAVQDLEGLLALGRGETNQFNYSLLWRAIEYGTLQKCVENNIGVLCYCPLAQGLLTGKFSSADDVPEGRARTRLFSPNRPQSRHTESGFEEETFAAIDRIRAICNRLGEPMSKVALAWLLRQPGVAAVLAGVRDSAQMLRNAEAGDLKLPLDVVNELSRATDDLKEKVGPNPDMWQTDSRMR